jgi:glycosyltransferase involved in cell wall biosynthesis
MATANPLWGAPRIQGELRTLGVDVSERTVSSLLKGRDHASTDDTCRVIQEFAASAAFPVRSLRADAPALSGAKNQAIAAARGEILAFTDDDCYPRPDYLLALADVFQAHDIGVLGGRVVLHDPTDANVSIRDVDTPASIAPGTLYVRGRSTAQTWR